MVKCLPLSVFKNPILNINLPNGQYTSFLNMTSNGSQSQSFQITLNSLENIKMVDLRFIKKNKVDYILDFLGQGMVAESWLNPHHWYQTNVVSKVKLYNYTCRT